MNRFIIVDGLPFLYANGKAYAVRWDDKGFTVGAEVEIASVPTRTYSELSIMAKCKGHLDSIGQDEEQDTEPGQEETSNETEETTTDNQETEPEQTETDNQEVSEEQDTEPGQEETVSVNLEDMKLDELKEYAANNGISLNGARTKATIIEAIRNAKG